MSDAGRQPRVANKGIITFLVMCATVMQSLDTTIANVALPHIQGTVAGTQDEMGWVLTSYIVAAAITIPLTGWLANRFGRRPIFLISVATFTFASALCGMAQSVPEIVAFRFLQGIGGAALVPFSQAVLLDINGPKEYPRAMSVWSVGVMVGPILGPVLGGWLTEDFSWRWVFYINLPIGILVFFGLMATLRKGQSAKMHFDFFGFATLALAVGALQVMLDRGQEKNWFSSTEIIVETVVAGLAFYLFVVQMFTSNRPFINPGLFRNRNFIVCIFIGTVGSLGMYATLALLPPMLQSLMQYPVILTGMVTAPRGMGMLLTLFLSGRLIGRFDARLLLTIGVVVSAYGLWQMTHFSLQMDYWPIVISGVVQGLGLGLVFALANTLAFTTIPMGLRNEATAFWSLVRNMGSSIGISVTAFLQTQNTQIVHSTLTEHLTPYNIASNPAAVAAHVDITTTKGLAALNAMITQQASMIAYIDNFWMVMLLTLATAPFILLLRRARPSAGGHAAAVE